MGDKPLSRVQIKKNKQSSSLEQSDGETELSPSQILERVKPDRVTVTKPEEDRRRRTIIVEKCSDSFGFTLQSYGIHYKKEQEIEMITYVDYVEYDGPAYRAGMREGDVILSINGHDMEKTDHKTLVNFIKNCDGRMRMVVLFEDCVRKVELHMRYIHLQRLLQAKVSELERLTIREKEVMEGKWKTHSLPARKKGSKQPTESSSPPYEQGEVVGGYCRPTMSTEDVARATPPPGFGPPLILAYRHHQPTYVDQHGRPYVIQPPHSSRDYVQAWSSSNYPSRSEQSKGVVRRCSASGILHDSRGYHQSNGIAAATPSSAKPPKVKGSSSGSKSHHCNPCMTSAATSPQDNTSLEAYDLASPCCNSHCVPSRRRRHHHKPKKSSSVESNRGCEWKEKTNNSSGRSRGSSGYVSSSSTNNQNAASSHHHHHRHHHHQTGRRYLNLVSQCSLHSCTSSEVNSVADKVVGNDSSAASYSTSLSTDTLYWEPCPNENTMARTHSIKSNASLPREPTKPKSWDNLTTKAFGGYGFGYGYIDRGQKSSQSTKSSRKSTKFVQPTKSSESLLLLPEYPSLGESSLSCECLETTASPSPPTPSEKCRFYTMPSQIDTYYHRDKASQTERRQFVNVVQAPEITRL